MSTRVKALEAGAELIAESAKDIGARCGIPSGIEAVTVLEKALAMAWADVSHFRGANDTPERLNEAIRLMQQRIGDEVRLQHFLRQGHKPGLTKGH